MTRISDREGEILRATIELVAERGLLGTTVALIAQKAQASPGIIYHYFASKDEIVHTLYWRLVHDFSVALLDGVDLNRPLVAWLAEVWLNSYRYFVVHPQQAIFMEQYKNSAYQGQAADPYNENPSFQALIEAIEEEIKRGAFKPLPMPVIYELTIGRAIALAKLHISGTAVLDDQTLAEIASDTVKLLIK